MFDEDDGAWTGYVGNKRAGADSDTQGRRAAEQHLGGVEDCLRESARPSRLTDARDFRVSPTCNAHATPWMHQLTRSGVRLDAIATTQALGSLCVRFALVAMCSSEVRAGPAPHEDVEGSSGYQARVAAVGAEVSVSLKLALAVARHCSPSQRRVSMVDVQVEVPRSSWYILLLSVSRAHVTPPSCYRLAGGPPPPWWYWSQQGAESLKLIKS
jgi:hypothetical protein